MFTLSRSARVGIAALSLAGLGACAQTGGLGEILGSVLGQGAGGGNQVTGTIQRVDTRNQQIAMTQSNGQQVTVSYDANTKVVYNNQQYGVTSLEYGDQVTARIQQTQNGGYYTDLVQVNQPVNSTGTSTSSGTVQTLQGIVRSVDTQYGTFTIDASSNVLLTVSMPYNPSRTDLQRFQSLRVGDAVRFGGVYLSNTRVELRQFY